jgi:hypothetical protein
MIIESMTIQVLHVVFLALTPMERWGAAGQEFGFSAVEGWLTGFIADTCVLSKR